MRIPEVVVKENPTNEHLVVMVDSIHDKLYPPELEKRKYRWWKAGYRDEDGIYINGYRLPWSKGLWVIGTLITVWFGFIIYYGSLAEKYKAGYVKYTLVKMHYQEEKPASDYFRRLDSTYSNSDNVDERLEYFESQGWE